MNVSGRQRIEMLRKEALSDFVFAEEMYFHFFKRYKENENIKNIYRRYADAFAYALSKVAILIGEYELVVGRFSKSNEFCEEEWQKVKEYAHSCVCTGGQDSHMAIDYEKLLKYGINGIIAQIQQYMSVATEEKIQFYNACIECLMAVNEYSKRYSNEAVRLAECTGDEKRKKELLKIADICKRVPEQPAESFYEAVQTVNFITHCISYSPFRFFVTQTFQLGHPDRYLSGFYEQDIKNGVITKDEAQELIDSLAVHMNLRVANGSSNGYMVGGRNRDGSVVLNDLTYMFMQAIEDVRLVYPAVGLCYTEDMGDEVLQFACELLAKGYSHPAIFNDDIITEGLMGYGLDEEEAHSYIHSTCVEITPVASSNVWVASPYVNMPSILLDIMNREYDSFDEFKKAYIKELDITILRNFEDKNSIREQRSKTGCNPLLSCFVNDCLEEGIDIERGGARYNWIMPSFVGMANLVDSLHVIKKLVFENKELTIHGFKAILDKNFEGEEELHHRILNKIDKYGNDIDEVDEYFKDIIEHIVSECEKYVPYLPNARLVPSAFCWIRHETMGRVTGATPDGREAGFPLGDGSGPRQGCEKNGPTASVLSSTKWSHKELIGGVAVNMKFTKKTFSQDSGEKMLQLIKTYLKRGGFEMQINVVDKRTLEKAKENPEAYRDLIVRIGGYSDYFVRLSPGMQAEVMQRTEHSI